MLILQRGVLFDNIFLYLNNTSVSRNIEAYLYNFNNQYLNLLQYFEHRDMNSSSKQLSFPLMENTNNSNQTGIQSQTGMPTSNNSINTEQFQCHSMIDSITESLKGYLSENLGTLKHEETSGNR